MIDLISFLRNYYGISHDKLSFDKITHDDILELFPFIEESNRRDITIENITCGNVIGVYDRTKKIIYYKNPHMEIGDVNICIEDDVEFNKPICFSIDDLENLSKEELLSLRRKLRLNNQRKESYMINAVIKKIKKQEPKKYREKKEKLLIKERLDYDD